jgi:hypothetical protein
MKGKRSCNKKDSVDESHRMHFIGRAELVESWTHEV